MSEKKVKEEVSNPKRAVTPLAKKALVAKPVRRAAMSVKEVQRRMSPRTVRGKIAAINDQMKENEKAVAQIHLGVRALQTGIVDYTKKLQDAVVAMQSAISDQINENQAYVKIFFG